MRAPQYAIKSKIQIIDDQTSNSELAAFKDLQFLSTGGGGEISDEIEILSSRTNIIDIVKKWS